MEALKYTRGLVLGFLLFFLGGCSFTAEDRREYAERTAAAFIKAGAEIVQLDMLGEGFTAEESRKVGDYLRRRAEFLADRMLDRIRED